MEKQDTASLIAAIRHILHHICQEEQAYSALLAQVQPHYYESARNLLHYLSLRTFDLRNLQEELSARSISSLGHSEGYTLTNLQNILHLLQMIAQDTPDHFEYSSSLDYRSSRERLKEHALQLLGEQHRGKSSRIMVTMPSEAANDYEIIHGLLLAGMDIARINTSHDAPPVWARMIRNIRRGEQETGKQCLVYMDLPGPKLRTATLSRLEKKKNYARIQIGDEIHLVRTLSADNQPKQPLEVVVHLPEIFQDTRMGHRVYFDDGKIGGIITDTSAERVIVKINQAAANGSKLRPEKGINLPDSSLSLPALTPSDKASLPFMATHADIVGYSFVRQPSDVEVLQRELQQLNRPDIGIILKIETREAFENLPSLLLTAMRSPKIGVMIARGDLAVEIGFERIAEVQEEILWICEAAHIPGIWATQVLEKLARKGTASRAEITDAAMAARAECVMLNKGAYIVHAVATLDDIIRRMEQHQFKRRGNLRPLSVARRFQAQRQRWIKS